MSLQTFRSGYRLCLENAEDWYQDALLVIENGSQGHAYSMLVHALESLIQAYYCFLVYKGISNPEESDFKKVFSEHRHKLNEVFGFIFMYLIQQMVRAGRIPPLDEIEKKYKKPEPKRVEELDRILKIERSNWRKDIEDFFAKSRYVHYLKNDEAFTSPKDISIKDIKLLIDLYRLMKDTISTLYENSSDDIIEEMKDRKKHERK